MKNTIHAMKLNPEPFSKIKSGQKTIELRLYDEKRQQIKEGDTIIFTDTATGEKLQRTVRALYRFDSFRALYQTLPLLQCGYTPENVDTAHPSDMERYYSVEEQEQYGVVGIALFPPEPVTADDFMPAQPEDAQRILSLYDGVRGKGFCVWDETYPGIREIQRDLETGNLYVLTRAGNIIGAISVVPENELDGFDCWACKDGKEIARVVVDHSYQGQGLALKMVEKIAQILQDQGCAAVHLSVAKTNPPAYKTYIKAGFVTTGQADMYGNSYFLMERIFTIK